MFEPSLVVRPQDRVTTDKLVIAYSSVWPLVRHNTMTVFGMHHQLGRSAEDDMNKMSVIGHISLLFMPRIQKLHSLFRNQLSTT